jgi:molybdate transport system substrate-binding protein
MTDVTLKMISSMATRELLAQLAAQFQEASGMAVQCESGGGVEVAKRIAAGENFDVAVLAADAIDKLIASGSVTAPRVDLVRSGVAIAVRAGAPMPPVATEQEVRTAVLAAPSLSFSTGPSGVYLEKLFERWGILAQVRPRIVVPPPGLPVGSLVADGRAAVGFQQLSELMNLPGIQVLGPLPESIQTVTVFSAGVCAASGAAAAARELLGYMASAPTAAVKQRFGMASA